MLRDCEERSARVLRMEVDDEEEEKRYRAIFLRIENELDSRIREREND